MERNYWLHRISHENQLSYILLKKYNLLSIGFSDFSTQDYLTAFLDNPSDFDNIMKREWPNLDKGRWTLWRFLTQMKQGDYVVVPRPGVFDIYIIIGNKPLTNDVIDTNNLVDLWNNTVYYGNDGYLHYDLEGKSYYVDLGFYWEVEPIAQDISRYDYADQYLTSRMKIRQTNAGINDIKSSIEQALNRVKNCLPINIHSTIIKENTKSILDSIRSLIGDMKFEELVSWYMKSIGADDVDIPSKNSSPTEKGDADVIAYFERLKVMVIIQVKKHEDVSNDDAVKQITLFEKYNGNDDYLTVKWVISSCDSFSELAIEKAHSNNVRLINGPEFVEMILDCGLHGLKI